ncbi:Hsp20/alpha crystallin family protein [bacterium]|nr:Hsp20/alpha crystallin family protein [bacterium]
MYYKESFNDVLQEMESVFKNLEPKTYFNNYNLSGIRFKSTSTDESIVVKGQVPGYSKKDITIKVEDSVLYLTAEENSDKSLSGFTKKYSLLETIDVEGIEAVCENGLLTVTLPKYVPEVYTKTIKVK